VDFVLARKGKDFVSNLPWLSDSQSLEKYTAPALSETISGCAGRYPDQRSGRYLASQDDILAARGQKSPGTALVPGLFFICFGMLKT
jgi:hypothetical protein